MAAIHEQLLAQSAVLSAQDPGRPVQASLRRASSAAYYALFHFLLDEIGAQLVGAARRDRHLRQALARWRRIRSTREARVFGLAAISWRGLRGR